MPASFLDSNVLLYALLKGETKAAAARQVIADGGVISVQILNEVANVARRRHTRSWDEVLEFLEMLRQMLEIRPLTIEDHLLGLRIGARYRLAIYDAMIVAAALNAGCDTLWTEDLQHSLVVDGTLTIQNPFH